MKPVVRCSELDRVILCGASRVLADMVAERESDTPHEGNMIHWEIAARLITELGATPPPGGLPPPDVPAGYVLPKFSEWIVGYCFDTLRRALPAGWSLEVEVPLAYEFGPEEPEIIGYAEGPHGNSFPIYRGFILSGHIDAFAVNAEGTEAMGWDWKSGYNAVDPAEFNRQVLGYIVLMRRAYPNLRKATFIIVQPRNDEEEGQQRVSVVTVEDYELEACVIQLELDMGEALTRSDEVNSGHVQCKYCPVGIQCPAQQAELSEMKLKLTPESLARIKREPDDKLLGDVIIMARTVAGAIEQAETLLHERLDKTQRVTAGCGVSITRKIEGGKYKVIDPVAMLTVARSILPDHRLAHALNWSTTRLKDLIADVMNIPKSGKAPITAETVFDGKFKPMLEQGQRKKLIFT